MSIKISKLVIPAAGLGSRFLPITKAIAKEMLPLNNKPALQYIVEEAMDAQIDQVTMIISPNKSSIINYFSKDLQLERLLAEQNKSHLLKELNTILTSINFQYSIQDVPLGVANALLKIQHCIQPDEFFAMAYPDDIIIGQNSEIGNLIKIAQEHKAIVIGLMQIPKEKISSYGVINPGKQIDENLFEITDFIEKPTLDQAPSDLAIVGRFVLHYDLFNYIKQIPTKNSGEIIWFDALKMMIKQGYKVLGFKIQGQRFDTGTPKGWIECINYLSKVS